VALEHLQQRDRPVRAAAITSPSRVCAFILWIRGQTIQVLGSRRTPRMLRLTTTGTSQRYVLVLAIGGYSG
jgi:hypothetical protein